ncbi:MAG TPA: single-stranded DNA-binding protein [Solirubrobacteraceae bacterium]|nr:single-stranded DNA-binding protein [Solirubrobacteraceae bacterium]
MATINRVVLVGNLTRDPELRTTASGTSVCRLRIACSTSWRNKETGELDERPNYFDVSVFGASGEACARFLAKGRPVAVDGRLEWHEWTTPDGESRQAVGVLADSVQFLASRAAAEADGDEAGAEEVEEAIAF